MADFIIVVILILILGAAVCYIRKAKRGGQKCIGCPNSRCASGSSCGSCSCGEEQ